MALFVVTHRSARAPAEAWARVTDWSQHGRYVPLTRMTVTTPPPNGVGTVFLARTGIGPLGFDDPMEITEWRPPEGGAAGHCRIEKRGHVMTGWAELDVVPEVGGGSRTTWREDITVWKLPGLTDPATVLSSRLLFGRVLRKLID